MASPNPNTTPGHAARKNWVGTRNVVLLDLTWGGVVYRVATEPIELSSDDGALTYDSGLAWPEYTERVDRDETQSVDLEVWLPVNVALRRQRGHDLLRATGELSVVTVQGEDRLRTVDQAWEGRLRLFRGKLAGPRHSAPERLTRAVAPAGKRNSGWLAFTLEQRPQDDHALLLGADAGVISDTAWASAEPDHIGKVYPLPIGTVGVYQRATATGDIRIGGSPAWIVILNGANAEKLIISGAPVAATTVTIVDEDGATQGSFAVVHEADGLGQVCATVDITIPGSIDPTHKTFYASFNDGGGIDNPYCAGALELGGHVVRWALSRSALMVDHGRWAAATEYLNRITIATYIDDPEATPWDWLADNVLDLYPFMSILQGPQGLYPVVLDPRLTKTNAEPVTEGPEFSRVAAISVDGQAADAVQEVVFEFAIDQVSGERKRRRVLTSDWTSSDPEHITNSDVQISRRRYTEPGEPPGAVSIDTDVIYGAPSADVVLFDTARRRGFIPDLTAYEADVAYGFLGAGALLSITDASAEITDRLGRAIARTMTRTSWIFTVRFDEDPARDPRAST